MGKPSEFKYLVNFTNRKQLTVNKLLSTNYLVKLYLKLNG